jgi:hypothetical protein
VLYSNQSKHISNYLSALSFDLGVVLLLNAATCISLELVCNPARCYEKYNKYVVCNFIVYKDTFVVDEMYQFVAAYNIFCTGFSIAFGLKYIS